MHTQEAIGANTRPCAHLRLPPLLWAIPVPSCRRAVALPGTLKGMDVGANQKMFRLPAVEVCCIGGHALDQGAQWSEGEGCRPTKACVAPASCAWRSHRLHGFMLPVHAEQFTIRALKTARE
jgi:hypothetical protein